MLHHEYTDKLYLNYEGPFNIQIISGFAKFLSELTMATQTERKKLYRVFIELTQNVALYSFERSHLLNSPDVGKGQVSIIDTENEFKCITINRIQRDHVDHLLKNCTEINTTPIANLRTKKRELTRMSSFHDSGAHIGLIMISIYSENPIGFEIIEEKDDLLYFKIEATINKSIHQ